MKTTLTIEQSAELIKHGVSKNRASIKCPIAAPYQIGNIYIAPAFTLTDLFLLLPQVEHDSGGIVIGFDIDQDKWAATYEFSDYIVHEDELIDSLYKLVLHLLDNHVKLD